MAGRSSCCERDGSELKWPEHVCVEAREAQLYIPAKQETVMSLIDRVKLVHKIDTIPAGFGH
jgi:hypothetical protein